MAHFFANRFPNVFLWIQVRAGRWEKDDLQTRVLRQYLINRLTTMPRSSIPEQDHRHMGIGFQDHLQMLCRNFSVHQIRAHGDFLSSSQVQAAIEIGLGSSWVCSDNRRSSRRRPDITGSSLQVQSSFITSQENRLRRILSHIDQFFSSCSSKSATFASLRDLKTFAVF